MKNISIAILVFLIASFSISSAFAMEGVSSRAEFKARRNEIRSLLKNTNLPKQEQRDLREELKIILFELRGKENQFHRPLRPIKLTSEAEETSGKTDISGFIQGGKASFYHDMFHGRKTASGEIFSNDQMTAAHRTLPLGTWVRVTYAKNGKSIVVFVNDRGPYVTGRIIDLSKKAFQELDSLRRGVIEVTIEVLEDQ